MRDPLFKDATHMVFRQRNQIIQTFPPQRAEEPLAGRIRLRTPHRGFEYPQPQVAYALIQLLREDRIAVMNQETVVMVSRHRVTQLLQRPLGRGMRRHIAMQDPARGVLHQYEDV
jgi:hypothetical protein